MCYKRYSTFYLSNQHNKGREKTMEKRVVMVVDDQPVMVELLRRFIEGLGLESESALDGLTAWEKIHLQPEKYCMIITDLHMKGLSGLDLARKIKENFLMPVILFTGDTEIDKSAIADAVMYKPCRMEDIQRQVVVLINQYYTHSQA